jgi:hypothetical protein
MSDYTIVFNVFGAGPFTDGAGNSGSSLSGHMNVTFIDANGSKTTIGATTIDGIGFGGLLTANGNDGIIRNEDGALSRDHVSVSVPVTEAQFNYIKSSAGSLVGQTFSYALLGQTCAGFANAVYQMTGHPGQVGDLFTTFDQLNASGAIW